MYAIGGQCEDAVLASVERYDVAANAWVAIEGLLLQRAAAAAAVLDGHIYVIGGSTMCNASETATVERMHLATEKWMMVCSDNQKK